VAVNVTVSLLPKPPLEHVPDAVLPFQVQLSVPVPPLEVIVPVPLPVKASVTTLLSVKLVCAVRAGTIGFPLPSIDSVAVRKNVTPTSLLSGAKLVFVNVPSAATTDGATVIGLSPNRSGLSVIVICTVPPGFQHDPVITTVVPGA